MSSSEMWEMFIYFPSQIWPCISQKIVIADTGNGDPLTLIISWTTEEYQLIQSSARIPLFSLLPLSCTWQPREGSTDNSVLLHEELWSSVVHTLVLVYAPGILSRKEITKFTFTRKMPRTYIENCRFSKGSQNAYINHIQSYCRVTN